MPKHKTLSQVQIEMNDQVKTQKVEVQAKRAKSAQKKARKEAIEDSHEQMDGE